MAVNTNRDSGEIVFRVLSRIGVVAEYQTGWTKELNLISWNGGTPKYDLRDWDPEHAHMSKGITLHEAEAKKLMELLSERFAKETHVEKPAEMPAEDKASDEEEEKDLEENEEECSA